MIELIFIGIVICIIIYSLYAWYYSNIKKTNEFVNQVFQYLKKRYKRTEIEEYGGGFSTPQIISHEAGPFKLIKVTTETQRRDRKNLDVIIRGEVDPSKYKKGNIPTGNLSVYLKLYFRRIGQGIQTKDPAFDSRFMVLSPDPSFALQILTKSNLGALIKRSYDLKAYEISWRDSIPIINIKMDTTNIDSFIRAFNILLGSVGTLTELGYLVRKTSKGKTTVRSLKFPTKEERKIPRLVVTQSSITSLKQESASHAFNHTNLDLKDIPTITNESIPSAPIIKQEYSEYKQSDVDILSLFSSIKFQVLNILIEESCIKIQPLSADENEITVTFAEENLVLFRTTSNRLPKIPFELFIKGQSVQDIDWLNPWKNVTIEGSSELRDIIRSRKDIANLLSTDQIEISSNGNPNDGINITVSVEKSYEGIRIGYRIIRDFLWFLEMELAL